MFCWYPVSYTHLDVYKRQAAEFVASNEQVILEQDALAMSGHWQQLFANESPLHLEIGMGRGRFLMASAAAYPQINFIGLELCEEVIMQALRCV